MEKNLNRTALALFLLVIALVWYACLGDITQTTNPSSVDVDVTTPSGGTGVGTDPPPTPAPTDCRIELDPPSPLTVEVSKNVNTKVVTFSSGGGEIPTEGISVNVANPAIASLVQIDGRFVMFAGNSVGQTSAIISTACAQTAVVINVT